MTDKTVRIDGDLTLDEIKSRCVFEQDKAFQLEKLQGTTIFQSGQALLINNADFVFTLDRLKTLVFVELGSNNPDTIKEQKKAEDFTFLFSSKVFVKNTLTNVLAFAK